MSRLHKPVEQHIHGELCSELNQMSIRIKAHHHPNLKDRNDESAIKLRAGHPEPTWMEIEELIMRCFLEMNQCTKPYKIH